jgi:thioredoxin-like negative regulator of GroEL
MQRTERNPARVRLALDVTRDLAGARIRVSYGNVPAIDKEVSLTPRDVWRTEIDAPPGAAVTFEVADVSGRVVLRHVEGVFDRMAAKSARTGPQPDLRPSSRGGSVAEIVERGMTDELEGRRLTALSRYRAGLAQHPQSLALLKAAGRLAVSLGWTEAGGSGSPGPIEWLESAHLRNTTDFEVEYYLGLALEAAGRGGDARQHLDAAQRFRATGTPATLQLARLLAKDGQPDAALRQIEANAARALRTPVVGALEVALLRRLGRDADARERAHHWKAIDPTSSVLRYELTLLGEPDPGLWEHLAGDANRVLDVVDQYLASGGYADALGVLAHSYPQVEPPMREPGAVAPQDSPLVAYYRGYVRKLTDGDADADYAAARSLATTYVFPNRRSSYAVLKAALQANPDDATARFLLGSQYLASGLVEPAIEAWQRVRRAGANTPTLHRNLGLALLQDSLDDKAARAVLEEGTTADPGNVEVYLALDGVLSAGNASARERVDALRRFPAAGNMPASLVFKLALALAEAGDATGAERLFHDRFFPREEGGTSVRTVYTQVRITSARKAADAGGCDASLRMLDDLSREQPGLAFTSGGVSDALTPPLMNQQVAAIEWVCGRKESARARWDRQARALAGDAAPLTLAIADVARRRLGRVMTNAERARLERALEAATSTLESAGTSSPGLIEYARASLLSALGRSNEARESYRRVFTYPDRGLSHALARPAMGTLTPGSVR